MSGPLEKRARTRAVFRAVNERIAELTRDWNATGVNLYICECSDNGCAESLEMSVIAYEHVRADATRFILLPGHQDADERVVDRRAGYVIVEVPPAGRSKPERDPSLLPG